MKRKTFFRILSIMLCTVFVCIAFSGCVFGVNANIESIEINVDGFENGVAEITVAKDDYDSLYVNASITWAENTNNTKNLNVAWEFIGDDLDCSVLVIDPGCTKGTIAVIELGGKTGKVVLRATAKSKNEVSADLTIWIMEDITEYNIFLLNDNFNGEFKFAEAMPMDGEIWDNVPKGFYCVMGFGCYVLYSDDEFTRYIIGGYPDCLDEYAITNFSTTNPKYQIFGLSVGDSPIEASDILTHHGYTLSEEEASTGFARYVLGKITITFSWDCDDGVGGILCIGVGLDVTNIEGVVF